MKKTAVYWILPILLFLTACARSTTEDAPWNSDTLPVVFSTIAPGCTVQVSLSETYRSGYTINETMYPQAKVYIAKQHDDWTELTRYSTDSALYTDMRQEVRIEKGETYLLRVEIDELVLSASSTVPAEQGFIKEASIFAPPADSSDGMLSSTTTGVLTVEMELPDYNKYKCLLYTSYPLGEGLFLNKETFVEPAFYFPKDSTSVELSLITCDPLLEKYFHADYISDLQNFNDGDISAFLFSFGGVMPAYSNIKNGIGLFCSYIIETKQVKIEEWIQ